MLSFGALVLSALKAVLIVEKWAKKRGTSRKLFLELSSHTAIMYLVREACFCCKRAFSGNPLEEKEWGKNNSGLLFVKASAGLFSASGVKKVATWPFHVPFSGLYVVTKVPSSFLCVKIPRFYMRRAGP